MVERETLKGIADYINKVLPDWEGEWWRGALLFKRERLTVKIDVPLQWERSNQLQLAMTATLRRRHSIREHCWIWNETTNPQFIDNTPGFPDDDFDAICRLINEVSLALRQLK
jgi:hypothetical protein